MNFKLNLILFLRLSAFIEACHFYKMINVNVNDLLTCRAATFPTKSVTECILRCSQDSNLIGSFDLNVCNCLERKCFENNTMEVIKSSNDAGKTIMIFEKLETAMKIGPVKGNNDNP